MTPEEALDWEDDLPNEAEQTDAELLASALAEYQAYKENDDES